MKIEKNRHLMILDGLMKANGPVTAEQLAFLADSSVRTVKADLPYLSEMLEKENIATIRSYKAKGYRMELLDSEAYAKFAEDLLVQQRMYYRRPIDTINRRLYIIHSFLAQDFVSLEELGEKLHLSDSSIRKELEQVRSFFASYHLDIEHEAGHVYCVRGREEDIRSAQVEIHGSQYHEFQQTYLHEGFNLMFYRDKQTYENIRQVFLRVLRKSDMTVSDIAAKKIPTYICLVKSRLEKGKTIQVEEELAEELRKTYDYQIAKEIVSDPIVEQHCRFPEDEILHLTRLILANRDIDLRTRGIKGLYEKHLYENGILFDHVMNGIKEKLGRSLYNAEFFYFFRADLISLQMQIYYKHRFDSAGKDQLITYVEGDDALLSPVPAEMTRIMICELEKQIGEPIRDPVILAYAQLLEKLFKKVTYPYKKLKLLACSTEGLVYTQNMIENMLNRFDRYIESIESYNLYEMRKLDFSKYDALVHSGNLMYYRYPLKAVSVREVDYRNDSSEIFDSLFKYGYDRSRLEELKKIMNVHPDTQISDVDEFIEKMCYRYGKDYESQRRLYEQYRKKKEIIDPYSLRLHSFLTFFDHNETGREFIDIYLSRDGAIYGDAMRVSYVIIASLDPRNSVASLKIDNHIIQFFIQVDGSVERVLADKNKALDEMYERIIEVNFKGY